jgi:hypothetical protein
MKIGRFVPSPVKGLVFKAAALLSPGHGIVASRWIRRPELASDSEVCLFVAFARTGQLSEHSIFHARAWAANGFQVVVIVVCDSFDLACDESLSFAAGILLRQNRGYDFGAWAAAINQLPELRRVSLLATVNDSVFGPLQSFKDMLAGVRQIDADVIGTTESFEYRRHFQSFLLFFKHSAVVSDGFWEFWGNIRTGSRRMVIHQYETRLVQALERSDLKCVALFPSSPGRRPYNQTLSRWRELLDDGFPYVKISLIRDNPLGVDIAGWEQELESRDYDPAIASRLLGS